MITRLHNLTYAATDCQKNFWLPVATPCFGQGLRHDQELFLSLLQAFTAGNGSKYFGLSNASDKTAEYPAPPIAPTSLHRKVTS